MLLPIGHEEATVRRMPWVTLTIIALCTVTFFVTAAAPIDNRGLADRELRIVEYYLDHPYLTLDPAFKTFAYYSLRQGRNEDIPAPQDTRLRIDEQRELDRLIADFYAARDHLPFFRWGLVPSHMQLHALVTHMLMHAGLLHLFGNLFILYLVGPALEDVWGRPLFAAFFVAAGIVAALAFVAFHPDLDEPLVGASGAIAGVMGAFALRFWDTRITFFYWVFFLKIYTGTFRAPAWLMLGLWAVLQLTYAMGLWALFTVAEMGEVAFLAHIAGFAFGLATAYLIKVLQIEDRFIEPVVESQLTVHQAPAVDAALELAQRGQSEQAMARLDRALKNDPRNQDAAAALWNLAAANGWEATVAERMIPPLEAAARSGDDSLPTLCWGKLLRAVPTIGVNPAAALRIGEMMLAAGVTGDVHATLQWFEERVDDSTPVGQLVRLARIADALGTRAPFAGLALTRPDLPTEVEAELRSLG